MCVLLFLHFNENYGDCFQCFHSFIFSPQLNLEKVQERWWDAVFINEPKINVREIDCSRPMSDLKEDEQMKIQELMYNERQKRLGLPQSHEEVL